MKSSSRKTTNKSKKAGRAKHAPARGEGKSFEKVQSFLELARLRVEKCELAEAEVGFGLALQNAKKLRNCPARHRVTMEALSGLLRLAGEAMDMAAVERWGKELDTLMVAHPSEVPPLAWHCKGTVAWYQRDIGLAQRCWHRCIRAVRREFREGASESASYDQLASHELIAKCWVALGLLWKGNKPGRSMLLAKSLLKRYEQEGLRGVVGITYLLLGSLTSEERKLEEALHWYQKAHARFLAEHNWYYHLYALLGYARIARFQRNYAQAYWHLDILEKATSSPHFAALRCELSLERTRLEQDAVDLLIDSRRGLVKTRDSGQISLRKQYILLHILQALSDAHGRPGGDMDRGLSKAEIIEKVWKENYRPEAHDNKLYYNINRLRKLIEPDLKKPQYLLNWKEGYRLAPGLRVQFLGDRPGDVFSGGEVQ